MTSKFIQVVDTDNDPHMTGKDLEEHVEMDELDENEDQTPENQGDKEEVDADESTEDTTEGDTDAVIPRFKGKTKKDISDAYVHLERDHGRLAQEVGDLRKMAREWLELESRNNKDKRKAEITDEELMENPTETISKVVEEKLAPVQKELEATKLKARMAEFVQKHPDYQELTRDQDFNDWIKASPYRMKLYQRADSMDFDAADELFSIYKDVKETTKKATAAKSSEKEKTLRKASSERGTASGVKGKKKVWSSAYLVHLKITDPEKYNALQPEILQAYNEGRVK